MGAGGRPALCGGRSLRPVAAGFVAGLVAVCLYAMASVLQAVGARRAAATTSTAQIGFSVLLRQRPWIVGVVLLGMAFLAFVLSTRVLPMPVAQALRSGYLVLTVLLGHAVFRTRPTISEMAGAVIAVVGIVLVVAPGGSRGASGPPPGNAAAMLAVMMGVLGAALLSVRFLQSRPTRLGLMEAVLAGLGFSVLDVGVRSLPDPLTIQSVLTCPACIIGGLAAPLGLLLFSRATARIPVGLATVVMTVVNVAAASVWASVAFGDASAAGPAQLAAASVLMVAGLVLMLSATRGAADHPSALSS